MASLIHDDVLDSATMRRNKPSINAAMGDNISIVFGDYIYSKAFELISNCRNTDIFKSICNAVYVMSEGELIHFSHNGDGWIRYKIILLGNSLSTPELNNISIFYQ